MMTHDERMAVFERTDLYVVITGEFCAHHKPLAVLDKVLAAGVRIVQLREKEMSDRALFELACAFHRHTAEAGALLIVDDRVDIALAAGADGVHLGQSDLPLAEARRIAPDFILGASTHSLEEALAAQDEGASYVNIGPIFETPTKSIQSGSIGPEMIGRIAPHLRIPFTVMGGIKLHNIGDVLKRGARHVAVVTAVTAARDVRAAAKELREAIQSYSSDPRI
jgi:thiamine-phosphate pyrophosphorylase